MKEPSYDKFIHELKNFKPVPKNAEQLTESVMDRVFSVKTHRKIRFSLQIPPATMKVLLIARISAAATAVFLLILFIDQQWFYSYDGSYPGNTPNVVNSVNFTGQTRNPEISRFEMILAGETDLEKKINSEKPDHSCFPTPKKHIYPLVKVVKQLELEQNHYRHSLFNKFSGKSQFSN